MRTPPAVERFGRSRTLRCFFKRRRVAGLGLEALMGQVTLGHFVALFTMSLWASARAELEALMGVIAWPSPWLPGFLAGDASHSGFRGGTVLLERLRRGCLRVVTPLRVLVSASIQRRSSSGMFWSVDLSCSGVGRDNCFWTMGDRLKFARGAVSLALESIMEKDVG